MKIPMQYGGGIVPEFVNLPSEVTLQGSTAFSIEISIAKTGYTPIGIVGWTWSDRSFGSVLHITGMEFDSSKAYIRGYNTGSTRAITTHAGVFVLYKQNV